MKFASYLIGFGSGDDQVRIERETESELARKRAALAMTECNQARFNRRVGADADLTASDFRGK